MAKYNLLFPLDVDKITVISPFGMRVHPTTGQRVLHEGIDLPPMKRGVDGDPIYAPENIRVRNAAWNNAGGNYMCLVGETTGLFYNLQHLSRFNAKAGNRVKRGDIVAYMGNTGKNTTGTHLHFAIGKECSPAGFIRKDTKEALNPLSSLFSWTLLKDNKKPTPPTAVTPASFSVVLRPEFKIANIALTPNGALYSPPIYIRPNIEYKIRGIRKDAKGRDWYWRVDGGYVYSGHVNKVAGFTDKFIKGNMLKLTNEPLYRSATAKNYSRRVTGQYYIYDGKKVNNRYRVTIKKDYVGKSPVWMNVTGWIKGGK